MSEQKYIHVRVTTGSKKESVEKSKNKYFISVKEKAKRGEANKKVKELLAKQLNCTPKQLRLIKGATTPSKTYLSVNNKY
jgi:uncharacterized protein YggU (UPF0235/DUF167 family)